MQNRFQIEDLIDQNESGVVFRATDSSHGSSVALRRFFPFGPDGGGLGPDEWTAYEEAVERLSGVAHPAMRSVVSGGCDKIDGMPFLVTEWIDGGTLGDHLAAAPLDSAHTIRLLADALDVCGALSTVFGEECIWIDTHPSSIVIDARDGGRGFTFWLSPFQWLGIHRDSSLVQPLIRLAEQAMHWQGRVVADQAGNGLGGWLKWLRANQASVTLAEARERLLGLAPPSFPGAEETPATTTTRATARPAPRRKAPVAAASTSRGVWWLVAVLALAAAALGYWKLSRPARPAPPLAQVPAEVSAPAVADAPPETKPSPGPAPAEPPPAAGPAPEPELSEAALRERFERNLERSQAEQEFLAEQEAAVERRGGVFSPDQETLIKDKVGQEVRLEGVVDQVDVSNSGATLYVIFRENTGATAPRGGVRLSETPELTKSSLEIYVGRKLRISGKLKKEPAGGGKARLVVMIPGRDSIEELAN